MIVGLLGFAFAFVGGRGTSGKGRTAGLGAVLDQSIGMHVFRSVSGHSTDPPADEVVPDAALTADEVAYRIGAPGAAMPRRDDAGARRLGASAATAVAADARTASATDAAPRRRLLRDSGAVLMGLSALGLVAIAVSPIGGGGGPSRTFLSVTRAQATRERADRRPVAGARRDTGFDRQAGRDPAADACPARQSDGSRAVDASDAKADPQADVAAHADPDAKPQPQEIDAEADPSADADPDASSGGEDHRGPCLW